jgi:predicted NAD-dependent protein-ADP-ribosyltransferase YbiA (DUF1768 family)
MALRQIVEKYYPEYAGWFDYPAEKTVAFNKAKEEWGVLGNFAATPLVVDGVPFDCAEKLFQVMKFSDAVARKAVYSRKGMPIKWTAKAYERDGARRPDWGSILVDALKFCLVTKYAQCEAFRSELARTGDRFIVETAHRRPDTYSAMLSADGVTWTGGNLMGRLLMELRDTGKLDYRLPEDALRFRDLLEP